MSYKFLVSETKQETHKFASVMLQEAELSAEPDRLLVNYPMIPGLILVYVCVCVFLFGSCAEYWSELCIWKWFVETKAFPVKLFCLCACVCVVLCLSLFKCMDILARPQTGQSSCVCTTQDEGQRIIWALVFCISCLLPVLLWLW